MREGEITEAIAACDQVLDGIEAAMHDLKGAQNWGIFDLLGGGFIVSLVKHGRLSRAQQSLMEVQYNLRTLQKELRDVSGAIELSVNPIGMNMLFDIAFDNIFSDLITQSRIHEVRAELTDLEADVRALRRRLGEIKRAM
ncbi:hypothetical protein DSECCO2_187510 [anaerobic digester metagenome]